MHWREIIRVLFLAAVILAVGVAAFALATYVLGWF
jgi:hypothetical protein